MSMDGSNSSGVTTANEFAALINIAVLENVIHLPKMNWKKRLRSAGLNGQLSMW